eukprot:gene6953-16463_t
MFTRITLAACLAIVGIATADAANRPTRARRSTGVCEDTPENCEAQRWQCAMDTNCTDLDDSEKRSDGREERFGVPIATQYNPWGVFPSATASYCPVCGMDGHRAGLSALVFRYDSSYVHSNGNHYNHHQQASHFQYYNTQGGVFGHQATVHVKGHHHKHGSHHVKHGGTFTVMAQRGFGQFTTFDFTGGCSMRVATSCSVPLRVGDIYGPLTLVGFRDLTGRSEATACNLAEVAGGCSSAGGCCPGTNAVALTQFGYSNCGQFNPMNPITGCAIGQFGCCSGTSVAMIDRFGTNCGSSYGAVPVVSGYSGVSSQTTTSHYWDSGTFHHNGNPYTGIYGGGNYQNGLFYNPSTSVSSTSTSTSYSYTNGQFYHNNAPYTGNYGGVNWNNGLYYNGGAAYN